MNKVKEISNGFANILRSKIGLTTDEEENLFKHRKLVCKICPSNTDKITCNECGCVIEVKTMSMYTECPKDFW